MTTYNRPVPATLWVHLENGEQWEATEADLLQFALLRRNDAECGVSDAMQLIGLDPEHLHSALRYALQRHVAGGALSPTSDAPEYEELTAWAPLVPACDPDDRPAS